MRRLYYLVKLKCQGQVAISIETLTCTPDRYDQPTHFHMYNEARALYLHKSATLDREFTRIRVLNRTIFRHIR